MLILDACLPGASPVQAAAVVAAIEQFIRATAPAPSVPDPPTDAWQQAALQEGVGCQPERLAPWL